METLSKKVLLVALKADLNAKKYVLIERMNKAESYEEYMEAFRDLNCIEHHLECNDFRNDYKDTNGEIKRSVKARVVIQNRVSFANKLA